MLSAIRRNAQSWVIKTLLLAVAVSFVIGFGAFMYVGEYLGKGETVDYYMQVNGVDIGAAQFYNQVKAREDYYRRMLGDQFEQIKANLDLEGQTREAIVDRVLLEQYAESIGVGVSDEEVRRRILSYPAFQRDGKFNRDIYSNILRRHGLTAKEFEADTRRELTIDKVSELLTGFVQVSEREAWNEYVLNATKARFRYVALSTEDMAGAVEVGEEAARAYFEEHKEDFRVPETRRGKVIEFSPDDFTEDIDVTEDEVIAYYERNRETLYTDKEQVEASHILRRVAPDASDEVRDRTREFTEDLLKRAQGGADFAELAAEYSQDETNKDKGGSLGYFERGRMEQPFEDLAFSLKPGEVGGVVETSFGYHVVKVTGHKDERVKDLDEVRDSIEQVIARQKAGELAEAAAREAYEALSAGNGLSSIAGSRGLEVTLTDAVARTEPLEGFGGGWQLTSSLFALEKEGEVSAPVKGFTNWYLVELVTISPAHVPAFEEVRDKVEGRAAEEARTEAAKQKAQDILDEAIEKESLKLAAEANGLNVQETALIGFRGETIGKLGRAREAKSELFAMTGKSPIAAKPLAVGEKVVLFERIDSEGPTEEGFAAVKDEIEQQLVQKKGQERFRVWKEKARESAEVLLNPKYAER